MGLLSHKVKRSDIVAGDHIYTWRASYVYAHHGIYLCKNLVIHFTNDEPISGGSQMFTSSSANIKCHSICSNPDYCGFQKENNGVKVSCLDCFLGTGSLYLYKYDVSFSYFFAKIRGGTCTTAKSDPPVEVVMRALYLLFNGYGKYDLLLNNCEEFALYCKTSLLAHHGRDAESSSGQVYFHVGLQLSAAAGLIFSGPVALGTAAFIFVSSHCMDIGSPYHKNVVKVKVEEIAKLRNSLRTWQESRYN